MRLELETPGDEHQAIALRRGHHVRPGTVDDGHAFLLGESLRDIHVHALDPHSHVSGLSGVAGLDHRRLQADGLEVIADDFELGLRGTLGELIGGKGHGAKSEDQGQNQGDNDALFHVRTPCGCSCWLTPFWSIYYNSIII